MKRYFIKLSYKGTHFFGWQIQPNATTIQEKLNEALTKLNGGQSVMVTGCGRTDTGVHASEYYAHVDLERDLNPEQTVFKLNCMLPEDVAVQAFFQVPLDLHSRFSATARTYHYFIHKAKNPFLAEISWLNRQELSIETMNDAGKLLCQTENFKSFSKNSTAPTTYICNVHLANWKTSEHGYIFTIKANRFLRNMVRAIVGTMVDLGEGKINLTDFQEIITSQDRSLAGQSAPAHGLFLAKIDYDNDQEIIQNQFSF